MTRAGGSVDLVLPCTANAVATAVRQLTGLPGVRVEATGPAEYRIVRTVRSARRLWLGHRSEIGQLAAVLDGDRTALRVTGAVSADLVQRIRDSAGPATTPGRGPAGDRPQGAGEFGGEAHGFRSVPVAPLVPRPAPVTGQIDATSKRTELRHGEARPAAATPRAVFDDGSVIQIDRVFLVGRDPAVPVADAECPDGSWHRSADEIRLVALADSTRSVSKTHFAMGVDQSGPWVVDRHSTNGTWIENPCGAVTGCRADEQYHLVAGSLVRFGERHLRVEVDEGPAANATTFRQAGQ